MKFEEIIEGISIAFQFLSSLNRGSKAIAFFGALLFALAATLVLPSQSVSATSSGAKLERLKVEKVPAAGGRTSLSGTVKVSAVVPDHGWDSHHSLQIGMA